MSEKQLNKNKEFYENQWKKGQSGNPTGKQGFHITTALKRIMKARKVEYHIILTDSQGQRKEKKGAIEPADERSTIADLCAMVLIQRGLSGDLKALDMILDRTEGKPLQRHEVKNEPTPEFKLDTALAIARLIKDDNMNKE